MPDHLPMNPMHAIKQRLSAITAAFDTKQRCIYVDYPLHANIGDLLINHGSEQFFKEQGLNIWRRYNQYGFPRRINGVTKKDVFLLHGGGNLGDLWEPYQSFRESILELYPENRVIFLPQTVHFQSAERKRESLRKMSAHRNLDVFTRDYASQEQLRAGGLDCVSMAPDMAHSLMGVIKPSSTSPPNSELGLIRNDREGSLPPEELRNSKYPVLDWDHGTIALSRRMSHPVVLRAVKAVGRYGRPLDAHGLWYWHVKGMIGDGVDLLSRYETIITNRLHAILLGLLLGRKVKAWDNSYGKLSGYYDAWLSNVSSLTLYRREPRKHNELQAAGITA